MILVDTSAWIEYLRGTGSPVAARVRRLIGEEGPLATTEVVRMELLAGARNDAEARELARLLARFHLLALEPALDFDGAARIYRTCRLRGDTLRSLSDCLVSAVALRHDAELLARDREFEAVARHLPLRLVGSPRTP